MKNSIHMTDQKILALKPWKTHVCTTFHFHGKQIKRIFIKLELLTNDLAIKQSIEKLISRVVYHEGGLDFRYVE